MSVNCEKSTFCGIRLGIRCCCGKVNGMSVTDIPNFEQLTDLERLELAEELIASIRNPEALPEPLAHRLELERRWAQYEKDPTIGLSEDQFWNKVKALKG